MANTTIQLKSSGISANIPDLSALANGELALNFADGILYYRTSTGAVESIRGEPTGLAGEIQFNTGGNFGASANLSFNSTTKVLTVDHAIIASLNIAPYAIAAFDKANAAATLSFTTITANGTSVVADSSTDTLTITSAMANGIFVTGTAGTDTLDLGLLDSGVTAASYGSTSAIPVITVDAKGRLTTVSTAAVDTTTASAAYAHANGAFTAANTKFASAGGTISGEVTITGNLLMSGTGYLDVPAGTTAQRPAVGTTGMFRYNSTTGAFEGYTSDWGSIGGAGGSITANGLFENANTITTAYTITVGNNGLSSGPFTMSNTGSVTVPTGSAWTIV